MRKHLVVGAALVAMVALTGSVVGQTRVPSVYDSDCKGLICQNADPRVQAGLPPPACQGLLCGMTPYSMERPITAAEAQRMQAEQARAQAAAAAASAPAEKPTRKLRHAKSVKRTSQLKPVASRTPNPAAPPAAPAAQ